MRQFLVQVDAVVDVRGFEQSMRDHFLDCLNATYDRDWSEAVIAEKQRPYDSTYFLVRAESVEAINDAVEKTRRYAKWHEGSPVYSVIGDREPPSYPA